MKKYICAVMAFVITIMCCVPAFARDNSLIISKNNITHPVSNTLYGVSLGDSNFAVDGGMNANLVNNNSFEYKDNPEYAWDLSGIDSVLSTDSPINNQNPTYETLTVKGRSTITNTGYTELFDDGKYNSSKASKGDMGFQKGVSYEFSCFLRNIDFNGSVSVYLDSSSNKGNDVNVNISNVGNSWKRVSAKIKSRGTEDGSLAIKFKGEGTICMDYVCLVPTNSYGYSDENWSNGMLRADFVNAIKNLKPAFIRFAIAGQTTTDSEGNFFTWKNTIGSLEKRKQSTNIKNDYKSGYCYNNSNIIGYHEYLQLASDIGAKPILVVGAGVKNQADGEYEAYVQALNKTYMDDDQWKEYLKHDVGIKKSQISSYTEYINSLNIKTKTDFDKYINSIALKPNTAKFSNYVQDILDMIEFANGESQDTYWGTVRAENGSEQPYGLEYIQIGDESWGDTYWRNFEAIKKEILKEYPNMHIIASTGSDVQSDIFKTAQSSLNSQTEVIADEHFYSTKGNKLSQNVNRFDSYDRDSNQIIIGELGSVDAKFGTYLSKNNLYSATEVASFIIGVEKNSDVVKMVSLTPTFAKINSSKGEQSMVWFDSEGLTYSAEYYTQLIFANNMGKDYVETSFLEEQKGLYSSTTVDESSSSIFVKLVNTSGKPKEISLSLDGFGEISSSSVQAIGGKYKSAFNSQKKQSVAPISEELEYEKNTTSVKLKPYSVAVVRIAYGENTGKGFFTISDDINTEVKSYLPMSAKVFIIMMVAIFILATVVTYLVYSKVVLKGKKFKFQFKNKKKDK